MNESDDNEDCNLIETNFNKGDHYCYMMVANKSQSEHNSSLKIKRTSNLPNRTVLGISQDPCYELKLHNQFGPTRNSANYIISSQTNGIVDTPQNQSHFQNDIEASSSSSSSSYSSLDTIHSDGDTNKTYLIKSTMRRKTRKRKKKGPTYSLAIVVSGFGKNLKKAKIFCKLWNDKSRGPIPRFALCNMLATKYKLHIYADLSKIFDEDFKIYEIKSLDNKILIQKIKTTTTIPP